MTIVIACRQIFGVFEAPTSILQERTRESKEGKKKTEILESQNLPLTEKQGRVQQITVKIEGMVQN
ncbi:uncharacterized protein METZ01_LOCUS377312 [marine metagenome]|uniref:Uncharacterized protein n=1 Tax=marine metagenome TaxID=408172 RepID=A0A382TSK8_9ZZZZ